MLWNIWSAAEYGQLDFVRYLVEYKQMSPNVPDAFAYTPMHSAASNGQIEILEYLWSRGGDPNVKDREGDTPLFFVESLAAAQWLVRHGAHVQYVNVEGISPTAHLKADFPDIAAYLNSLGSDCLDWEEDTPKQDGDHPILGVRSPTFPIHDTSGQQEYTSGEEEQLMQDFEAAISIPYQESNQFSNGEQRVIDIDYGEKDAVQYPLR